MRKTNEFPPAVEIVDGGTQGIYLLHYIEYSNRLLIFDALIPTDYELKVYTYQDSELPAFIHRKLSSHQIGLSDLLSLSRLHDRMPEKIVLIGVPPQKLNMNISLSPEIQALLPQAVEAGVQFINQWVKEI